MVDLLFNRILYPYRESVLKKKTLKENIRESLAIVQVDKYQTL